MRCRVDGENIPPGRFIPVAEKTGLIMHLGDWSLSTAATYARQLERQGSRIKVAVNVSRAQLLMPAFSKILHGVMTYTGVAPSQLELELTESLFMDKSEVVQKNLQAIIDVGISLALDDFGTGYSSLACLKDLPADKIKLDRAFVTGLPHDRRAFCVAKAVAQLAADLDITLVAEGVESKAQYEALREAGVAAVQGYYVARPANQAALEKWLSVVGV
jgi:EAL domain-containing protein (putative c-di-GMP-specific phosphodiesterase class I)